MLRHVCEAFGDDLIDQVTPTMIAHWRSTLPPPTRWQATQALKQVGAWASRAQLVSYNPFKHVANPRPWREEVVPFSSWEQIAAVSAQLPRSLRLLPWLGAGCGLRPGELLGLDWGSIDREARLVRVSASAIAGKLQSRVKTVRSRRSVPIRQLVVDQVELVDARSRSGLVFTSSSGGPLDLRNLRRRHWRPALIAAGINHPFRIYDLRHTYAAWSLRAGVSIYQLARRMGTSVAMIDATYGHLSADAGEYERGLLDAWDGEGR
jgi:integrase